MNNIQSVDEIFDRQFEAHLVKTDIQGKKFWEPRKEEVDQAKADLLKLIEGAMPAPYPANEFRGDAVDGIEAGYNQGVADYHAALKQLFGGNHV